MYQHIENEDGKIGLHDCRATHMSYENETLSFDFREGFYILNEDAPERSGMSKMKCHIIDEDIDGISIYIYRKTPSGMMISDFFEASIRFPKKRDTAYGFDELRL